MLAPTIINFNADKTITAERINPFPTILFQFRQKHCKRASNARPYERPVAAAES